MVFSASPGQNSFKPSQCCLSVLRQVNASKPEMKLKGVKLSSSILCRIWMDTPEAWGNGLTRVKRRWYFRDRVLTDKEWNKISRCRYPDFLAVLLSIYGQCFHDQIHRYGIDADIWRISKPSENKLSRLSASSSGPHVRGEPASTSFDSWHLLHLLLLLTPALALTVSTLTRIPYCLWAAIRALSWSGRNVFGTVHHRTWSGTIIFSIGAKDRSLWPRPWSPRLPIWPWIVHDHRWEERYRCFIMYPLLQLKSPIYLSGRECDWSSLGMIVTLLGSLYVHQASLASLIKPELPSLLAR
jgi:hypothetical protein